MEALKRNCQLEVLTEEMLSQVVNLYGIWAIKLVKKMELSRVYKGGTNKYKTLVYL